MKPWYADGESDYVQRRYENSPVFGDLKSGIPADVLTPVHSIIGCLSSDYLCLRVRFGMGKTYQLPTEGSQYHGKDNEIDTGLSIIGL